VDQEGIPRLQRPIERLELRLAERRGRRRRRRHEPGIRHVQRDRQRHCAGFDARLPEAQLRQRGFERSPLRGWRGGAHDPQKRIAHGGDVQAEFLQPQMQLALAQLPE
jgi:hypothetical protein